MATSNVVDFRAAARGGIVVPGGVSRQSLDLFARARGLAAMAAQAEPDEQLELAYRAALRGAGAILNVSEGRSNKRRRRRSQSAWENLKASRAEYSEWVARFQSYSELRNEVRLGLVRRIDARKSRELMGLVEEFLAVVEADLGILPAAA